MEAEMLTTGDVARSLGVTINTVKAWARAGRLDAVVLPSGHFRIPRDELDRLRAEGRPSAHRFRDRRRAWSEFERWRRAQPVEEVAGEQALAWIATMLATAVAHGPLSEPDPEETVRRVARLHRFLAAAPA